MRRSTVMWARFAAVVGGLSLAACSSESSGDGTTSDGPDADTSTDSGAVMADTGSPAAADTGTPVVDAGEPAADAGAADATVPADAGT